MGGPDSLGGLLENRSSSEESSKRPSPLILFFFVGGGCFFVGGGVGGFPTGWGVSVGSAGLTIAGFTC